LIVFVISHLALQINYEYYKLLKIDSFKQWEKIFIDKITGFLEKIFLMLSKSCFGRHFTKLH